MISKAIQKTLSGLFAFFLMLIALFLLMELAIRGLQAIDVLPRFSAKSVPQLNLFKKTDTSRYNAALLHSPDSELLWTLDPADSNVNQYGFRDAHMSINRRPETFRIAVLGDSYSYGFSVPPENTFPSKLELALQAEFRKPVIEVFNFGVIGYNTVQQSVLFKSRVAEFKPDIVVLGYVLNDIDASSDSKAFAQSISVAHQRLRLVSRYSQAAAFIYIQWIKAKLRFYGSYWYDWVYKPDSSRWMKTTNALLALRDDVEKTGARFVVVVYPFYSNKHNYLFSGIHHQLDEFMTASGITHLDLLPVIDQKHLYDYQIGALDNHPNSAAHALFAQHTARFLVDAGLITSVPVSADKSKATIR